MNDAREMLEIRGIRAPANQRHQGSEIINVIKLLDAHENDLDGL